MSTKKPADDNKPAAPAVYISDDLPDTLKHLHISPLPNARHERFCQELGAGK